MIYDMIFNSNWVATRWQLFSTHIHTNNTVNVTKQTIQRTQKYIEQHNNQEECGPCPIFAGFTLAFALQLRKKHGKTSVRCEIWNELDVHESAHRDTIMTVTNNMQLYRLIYCSQSALHVSGDVFAHHQVHLTIYLQYLVVFTQDAAGWCLG